MCMKRKTCLGVWNIDVNGSTNIYIELLKMQLMDYHNNLQ